MKVWKKRIDNANIYYSNAKVSKNDKNFKDKIVKVVSDSDVHRFV